MKTLKTNEIILLKSCLQKKKTSFFPFEDIGSLSEDQYNYLRDKVCDELLANGFLNNGEVSEYGKELENLIDSLGRFFM